MTKPTRTIFVIMPFVSSPTRNEAQLTQFFDFFLKLPIESCSNFEYHYRVLRSGTTFDINAQIIHELYDADIVICDLSGEHANPNVMYELGVRLATTHKPVIIIREEHADNKRIFDVAHYHTHLYRTDSYSTVVEYIQNKIIAFENGVERFKSPVLETLAVNPFVISEIERQRALALLTGTRRSLRATLRTLAGSLHGFLSTAAPTTTLPETVEAFPQFILDNRTTLARLDWTTYSFAPSLPPQLHTLLSDTQLSLVCDQWLAELWDQILGDYYGKYFSSTLFWSDTNFNSIYPYTMDTWHLVVAIELFVDLVKSDINNDADMLLKGMFSAILPMSLISDHFRETVLLPLMEARCSA